MVAGTIEYILKLRNELSKELGAAAKDLKSVGDDFTEVGKMASVGFTLPIVGAGAAALKFATDMNASMANVASLMPGSTERVKELKTEVQAMAIATGKSTEDLAGGLYMVVSAFGDTADTAAILNTNARAAAAGVATTTDAINLTSAVTKGYGDTSAAAVAKVADLALQTVKLGQTTFPELAASIGRVTPLTAELGVKQEELFGVMATFTGVTGGAAEVSTQLRGVLQSLMSPTESMADLFEKVGVKSGKALIEQRGLQGAMKLIVETAKSGGGDLKDYLGSIEGQTLALSAAGANSKDLTAKIAAMGDVAGVTAAAFKAQTDGINKGGHEWNVLKQTLIVTAQQIGDVLIPILLATGRALSPLLDLVLGLVGVFAKLPASAQTVVVAFFAIQAAAGPAMLAVGGLLNTIATLATSGVAMGAAGALKAIGLAALGAAAPLAAFAVAAASVVAIGKAVRLSVEIVNQKLGENGRIARENVSHNLALAEASRVAGRAVTDVAEANNILREHSAKLRAEQQAGSAAAAAALQQTREHAPAVKTLATALAAAKAELAALTPFQRENITAGLALGMSVADVAKEVKASEQAVGLYKDRLAELETQTKKNAAAQKKFLESVSSTAVWVPYRAALADAGDELQNIGRGLAGNGTLINESIQDTAAATEAAKQWAFQNGAVLAPSLRDTAKEIDDAKDAAASWGKTITGVIGKIPGLVQSAMTGGGGMSGAFKGIASAFGEAGFEKLFSAEGAVGKAVGGGLTKLFGDSVGGALSAALPGIGAALGSLIGPLMGKVAGMFGVSKEIKEARGAVDEFQRSLAATLTAEQRAEAGGVQWKQTVIAVRDAFIAVGGTAETAEALVRQLWDTDHPDRARAAMEQINEVLEAQKQITAGAAESAVLNWREMQSTAQELGIDLSALGPAFRNAQIGETAVDLWNKFEMFRQKGADVGGVLFGMRDEISKLVTDSIAFGTSIPENFRPLVEELMNSGNLIDANGNKLTDLSALNFGDPIVNALNRVVDTFQALVDKITAAVIPSINAIPRDLSVRVGVSYDDPGFSPRSGNREDGGEGYAAGTIGMTGSWFRDFGAGRQVTLHGQEAVVRPDQAGAFAAAHGGGDAAGLARIERLLRDQPRAMALALQNALALGGRA